MFWDMNLKPTIEVDETPEFRDVSSKHTMVFKLKRLSKNF